MPPPTSRLRAASLRPRKLAKKMEGMTLPEAKKWVSKQKRWAKASKKYREAKKLAVQKSKAAKGKGKGC